MEPIKKKLVIVGDGACGKTSLLIVFCKGEFPENHIPTVFEIFNASITIDSNTNVGFLLNHDFNCNDLKNFISIFY